MFCKCFSKPFEKKKKKKTLIWHLSAFTIDSDIVFTLQRANSNDALFQHQQQFSLSLSKHAPPVYFKNLR